MTLFSELFPDVPALILRKWFKVPGTFNFAVPAGASWMRASVLGAGGYGDQYSGGGAYVRSRVQVTPAENLVIQVGATSTATVAGDSFVKRNSGLIIAYADRGRGSGVAGQASNSTGDSRRSGVAGSSVAPGGLPASDVLETDPVFGAGSAIYNASSALIAATAGGGGFLYYNLDAEGELQRPGHPGGFGLVCLSFFDANPGL